MAIKLTPSASNTNTIEYLHTEELFSCRKSYEVLPDVCSALSCRQPIPVFADLVNTTSTRNNDFTKWRFTAPISGSVECILTRCDTDTTYTINDATYGIFMDVGDFATYPTDWAFAIEWFRVANLIGFGTYSLEFTIKDASLNTVFSESTPCYYLQPYSCDDANGTVRFEVLQNGYNQSGFDWSGFTGLFKLFTKQQIRLNGYVKKTAISETDYVTTSQYKSDHVQTRVYHEYEVTLRSVDEYVYLKLVKGLLLEMPVMLTVYDTSNDTNYDNFEVKFLDVEIEEFDKNRQSNVKITFDDYSRNNIKRY
jgi:hypothetical protein